MTTTQKIFENLTKILLSHSGKWTTQSNIKQFQFDVFNEKGNGMKILREKKVFGKLKLDLIGSFEGTRAIVCTKRGEKGEQRKNNQR